MGTVVAVCMFVTVLFTHRIPGISLARVTPLPLLRVIGVITGVAGLWNVLWYGLRHFGELWGNMALGSGLLMTLLSALLVLTTDKQPAFIKSIRPVAILGLLGFASAYAVTLYRL